MKFLSPGQMKPNQRYYAAQTFVKGNMRIYYSIQDNKKERTSEISAGEPDRQENSIEEWTKP
jgi:hypothetical protein